MSHSRRTSMSETDDSLCELESSSASSFSDLSAPHSRTLHITTYMLINKTNKTRNKMRGPHLASVAPVALASSPATSRLQTGVLCLLVIVWPGTFVPGWRHTFGLGRASTPAPPVYRQIVCCSTHTQHIRWQEFCCCRVTCLQQPPSKLTRRGHHLREFQAWT